MSTPKVLNSNDVDDTALYYQLHTMSSSETGIVKTSLPETETLRFLNSGKVRDLYEVSDPATGAAYLLFVATDRISAFDVILNNVSRHQR